MACVQHADDLSPGQVKGMHTGSRCPGGRSHGWPTPAGIGNRLGPLKRLDLGVLVDTENQCTLGRLQLQPHHIADLLDGKRVRWLVSWVLLLGYSERASNPCYRGGVPRTHQFLVTLTVHTNKINPTTTPTATTATSMTNSHPVGPHAETVNTLRPPQIPVVASPKTPLRRRLATSRAGSTSTRTNRRGASPRASNAVQLPTPLPTVRPTARFGR
jgi:hypothetical protein